MIKRIFPFLDWFTGYSMAMLRADGISGLTVALVLIPQSMAYAQLAGMPAYYGLYAAFLPPMVAALFGSSRQLGTGPVAVVSLMSAASLEPLATAGSPEFIAYSIVLALIVGIFQFLLGVLRLGLVVNFLSHPVVNGFTNAAAIIIASSQFSKFFGVSVDNAPHHYETMIQVAKAALDYTHLPTLLYGISAVVIMVVLRKINPRIPNVLVAVVVTTLISYFSGYNNDAVVDISTIHQPEVVDKISEFNQTVALIKEQGLERVKLANTLDEQRKAQPAPHGPTVEQIKLQGEINLITAYMGHSKDKVQELRSELRGMKFDAVEDGKKYVFYPKDTTPGHLVTDGRTWRIKVKNEQLDPAGIQLMGG
ncbi:MAG TPA: sodium-independent anion transporter, partial [Desulfobacter sp.]|nr:sodium-independent anion transporter [Desulfobacter sp.]